MFEIDSAWTGVHSVSAPANASGQDPTRAPRQPVGASRQAVRSAVQASDPLAVAEPGKSVGSMWSGPHRSVPDAIHVIAQFDTEGHATVQSATERDEAAVFRDTWSQ